MKKILMTSLLLASGPAFASANQANYEIDWRGVPVGEITFNLEQADDNYKVAYEVKSTGILALFFEFSSRGYSSGIIRDDRLIATTHSAISSVRGDPRSWTVGFGLDGDVAHLDVQEDSERDPVPEALRKAPDPLALALSAIKDASPGIELGGQSFDGRRAIHVDMTCDPAIQDGAELTCTLKGELLAGASKRWRDDHDDEDEPAGERPVKVTLARQILGDGWWPVRLEVESPWGQVSAVLARDSADTDR